MSKTKEKDVFYVEVTLSIVYKSLFKEYADEKSPLYRKNITKKCRFNNEGHAKTWEWYQRMIFKKMIAFDDHLAIKGCNNIIEGIKSEQIISWRVNSFRELQIATLRNDGRYRVKGCYNDLYLFEEHWDKWLLEELDMGWLWELQADNYDSEWQQYKEALTGETTELLDGQVESQPDMLGTTRQNLVDDINRALNVVEEDIWEI